MVGKAIVARLTGDTDIAAIVGNRVQPQFRKEDTVPAVVYDVDGGDFDGGNPVTVNVRLFLIGSDYAVLQDLANKVKASLHGENGTWGGVLVQGAFLEDESDDSITVGDQHGAVLRQRAVVLGGLQPLTGSDP